MITIRPAAERGHANHGWLDTNHTFSFADYYDRAHMGFRELRVINEDRVVGGRGFGTHSHRDMEIITYVLEGALEHRDSMGNGSVMVPGDVQRMSAGSGVAHSEYNASPTEAVHFLQIWIFPERNGLAPGYEQRSFTRDERRGVLRLIASHDGGDGAVSLNQDVDLYSTLLEPGESLRHMLREGRHAWVQVARGTVVLNGERLHAGDGAAASDERELRLEGIESAEVLLFDLP
jgi:redox-sensitive bicupin YhaK (pirin superfamily)